MFPYLRELVANRRALAAASVGMASGYTLNNYLNNLFIPSMMQEFHWQSSQIALLGMAATLSIVCQPLAGRCADRFGIRPVALFGTILAAAIFLAFSVMTGNFLVYAALVVAQIALVASTTAAVVYSRPVAGSFLRARGLALGLAICAPSLVGALGASPLSEFIESSGWRVAYRLVAVITLAGGLAAVWLAGSGRAGARAISAKPSAPVRGARLRTILANRNLLLIMAGMCLCSLSITMQTTQFKVLLVDLGTGDSVASDLIGLYAAGVIIGRVVSGVSLDIFPTRLVASTAMMLPAVGLLMLGFGVNAGLPLAVAVICIGLALGAEGDIAGYLVMTYLPLEHYSLCYGIVIGAISFAAGIGSLLLGVTFSSSGSFVPFLQIAGAAALLGGLSLLGLQQQSPSPA